MPGRIYSISILAVRGRGQAARSGRPASVAPGGVSLRPWGGPKPGSWGGGRQQSARPPWHIADRGSECTVMVVSGLGASAGRRQVGYTRAPATRTPRASTSCSSRLRTSDDSRSRTSSFHGIPTPPAKLRRLCGKYPPTTVAAETTRREWSEHVATALKVVLIELGRTPSPAPFGTSGGWLAGPRRAYHAHAFSTLPGS